MYCAIMIGNIATYVLQEGDEFLILACDGIWDVSTSESAREFVTDQLKAGVAPKDICERLLDYCLQKQSKVSPSLLFIINV
jgi:serine/threonine protein phosphatase PrpC